MRDIILKFENVKERLDDARKCLYELNPCKAKRSDDGTALFFKKEFIDEKEYNNIMQIKEKYNLKIQFL